MILSRSAIRLNLWRLALERTATVRAACQILQLGGANMFNRTITIAACLAVLPLAFASRVTQNALADPVNGVADAAFVFTVTMFLASLLSVLMFFFVQFSTLNLRLVKLDNALSIIFLGAASGLAPPLILQLCRAYIVCMGNYCGTAFRHEIFKN